MPWSLAAIMSHEPLRETPRSPRVCLSWGFVGVAGNRLEADRFCRVPPSSPRPCRQTKGPPVQVPRVRLGLSTMGRAGVWRRFAAMSRVAHQGQLLVGTRRQEERPLLLERLKLHEHVLHEAGAAKARGSPTPVRSISSSFAKQAVMGPAFFAKEVPRAQHGHRHDPFDPPGFGWRRRQGRANRRYDSITSSAVKEGATT